MMPSVGVFAPDMSEVPSVEVDYTVDGDTGEIKEQPEA